MQPSGWHRLRQLLTSRDDVSMELVMTANGLAALGVAGIAWLRLGLPPGWSAAVALLAFLILGACLLFRSSAWLALVFGSISIGATAGLLAWALAGSLAEWAQLACAAGGFLLTAGLAARTYLTVARAARRAP